MKGFSPEKKDQILKSLKEANYSWIVLSMLAGVLAHLSRAIRWRMLLEPLGTTPRLNTTFYAVMIGYFGNAVFPRAGEVLRCGIMKGYEKIPLTQSFGTVITERIIDVFILFLLFLFSAWREYTRLQTYLTENFIEPMKLKFHSLIENKLLLLLLIGIFVATVLLFFSFRKKIARNQLIQKIGNFLMSFLDGMRSVTKLKKPSLFIFHTVFIWTMYLLTVYLCVFAFNETRSLSAADCLVLMAFGSLGVIATPGGIGSYQWIVLQIMLIWGYSDTIGFAFGLLVWLAQTTVVLIGGPLCFGLLTISNKKVAPDP